MLGFSRSMMEEPDERGRENRGRWDRRREATSRRRAINAGKGINERPRP
jgi:hypothetical protein